MAITQLYIDNVRNLQAVRLQELERINVFFGRNGSGKTSVLESIHLLGMARSFRGNSIKPLIAHDAQECTVYGVVAMPSPSQTGLPLGVQRNRGGEAQIKVGGKIVKSVSVLAEQLPLQTITADSFGLLTGSPAARRQYLDWGVFHVEQSFFSQWRRFQRSIKQRNMLLRRGKISRQELAVWTRDLAKAGAAINTFRQDYCQQLAPRFRGIMAKLAPSLDSLQLSYRQGWDRNLSYSEALEQGLNADLEQGYTHTGPQRADVRVTTAGHLAADTLSRGQQKLVVCGLKLAQGEMMSAQGRGRCAYLIDDLPSELDEVHGRLVCEQLASMDSQVFITCVDKNEIRAVWPQTSSFDLFHVEQGVVTKCPEA